MVLARMVTNVCVKCGPLFLWTNSHEMGASLYIKAESDQLALQRVRREVRGDAPFLRTNLLGALRVLPPGPTVVEHPQTLIGAHECSD